MIGYVGKSYLRKIYKWLRQFHSDNSNVDDGHDLAEKDDACNFGDEEAKRCCLFIILLLNCFCGGTIFHEIYELWIGLHVHQKD